MSSIEINTSQHVSIEYDLASLRDRGVALFLDLVIIIFGALVVLMIGIALLPANQIRENFILFLAGFAPTFGFMAYFVILETRYQGQTPGKIIMGIKVLRRNGQLPTLGDYCLRAFFLFLEFTLTLGALGGLLISATPLHQRFGDLTAGTVVVRTRNLFRAYLPDIKRIQAKYNHTPSYPEVVRLAESDLLLLRQVLARHRDRPDTLHQNLVDQLAQHLHTILEIKTPYQDSTQFLQNLLLDYIALTR